MGAIDRAGVGGHVVYAAVMAYLRNGLLAAAVPIVGVLSLRICRRGPTALVSEPS